MKSRLPTIKSLGLILLILSQATAVSWIGIKNSLVLDEAGHLPAGIYNWKFGRFDVYHVNPPLVRMVAAVPVVLSSAQLDWSSYTNSPTTRPEWNLGKDFVERNPDNWIWFFISARWMLIPFLSVGAFVCYRWSKDLYGDAPALIAVTLWCFSPNVLAWGATITPDISATAMGALAGYCFWKWLCEPSWQRAMIAGLTLGIVELMKTTWVVLFGVWPALWLIIQFINREKCLSISRARQFGQLGIILLLGLYILNVGYCFSGSFQQLKSYQFVSRTLAGTDSIADGGAGGNRFAESWLGEIPVPLPQDYLAGIDSQKLDFERGKLSYLNGKWKVGSWWYYYIVAIILKVPLGTLLLFLFAFFMMFGKHGRSRFDWKNEMILLAPAVVIFVLVSSQTGISYLRYLLPCFPFMFIWVSKVGLFLGKKHKLYTAGVVVALTWSVGSSLWVYPHSLSYFNELAGGPTGGHRYLVDANIDWGQDLLYLKEWYDSHPEARPFHTACFSFISPRHYGIKATPPVRGMDQNSALREISLREKKNMGPHPGWYALSIQELRFEHSPYEYFLQHFEPIDRAGYSIYIYLITLEEANRVRKKLGLPMLEE